MEKRFKVHFSEEEKMKSWTETKTNSIVKQDLIRIKTGDITFKRKGNVAVFMAKSRTTGLQMGQKGLVNIEVQLDSVP